MVRVFLLLALLFFISVGKGQNTSYPTNPYSSAFDSAYTLHPRIPEGVLEAIAHKMSHFRHLSDTLPESCTGMPRNIGVMGLVRDGKGVFRENLPLVAKLSAYSSSEIANDPEKHILAYAQAYVSIMDTLGINGQELKDHVPVLTTLSELPYDSSEQFALSARLYDIYQKLHDRRFQRAYKLPSHQVPFDSIFGPRNHKLLKSDFIKIRHGKIQGSNGTTFHKGQLRSPDYPPAIWDPAPSCNYSSRNGTPISHVTIHTMEGTYAGAIAWAQDCNSNVSFHYAIRSSDGQVTQLVLESDMAWHVGSENDYTIGIEHEGYINDPSYLTDSLYQSSADLCRDICATGGYGIPPIRTHDGPACSGSSSSCLLGSCIRIKGHQHFPNQTHKDPGPYYDWERYYRLINPNPPSTTFTQQNGTFYDSGGSGGNYSNDERQVYTIAPSNASAVQLTVNSFQLESGYDSLYIYDGAWIDAPLIGAYSGSSIPTNINSSGDSITLEFRSDCQTTKSGWNISWGISPLDSIPPSSSVQTITDWKTKDFDVSFTDLDSGGSGLSKSYYHAIHFDGKEWRANYRNGFFSDNFGQNTVHPNWTQVSGNWSIQNGHLVQNDEAVNNSNIHALLDQNLSNRYLYHWKGRIEGSGSNKRAGLHIFCSKPDSSQRGDSYFIWFREDDNAIQLYKAANNSWGNGPVAETSYPLQSGVWYDFKMSYDRINGDFDVYVNDSLSLEWKDPSPIDSGKAISFRNGNSIYRVDNMKVYRSRYPSVTVKVGPDSTQDLRYQNPSPSSSAGKLKSIAQDSAGNLSSIDQEKVDVDWTPPLLKRVRDGTGQDSDSFSSDSIRANWGQGQDPNSGIDHYGYAIDSIAGDSGIIGWTNKSDTVMSRYLMNPVPGTRYYTSVRAWNQAGLMAGDSTSDGTIYLESSVLKEKKALGKLTVYPSPITKGEELKLKIRAERPLELQTRIYDTRGRILMNRSIEAESGTSIHNYHGDLAAGVHHLHISGDGLKDRTIRFVVK